MAIIKESYAGTFFFFFNPTMVQFNFRSLLKMSPVNFTQNK